MAWTSWAVAWQEALYGAHGLYRQPAGPAAHFATATQGAPEVGAVLAQALLALMRREGLRTLVDVGCGRGELLEQVHRLDPGVSLLGVDVVDRPAGLSPTIGWLVSPGGAALPEGLHDLTGVLVLANEWLDVVPCTVAEVDPDGRLRTVEVEARTGEERLGAPVSAAEGDWCRRFWPLEEAAPGDRVEVGLTRGEAWADLVGRVRDGVAVAVDYGHTRGDRPHAGTLTGFRDGRQVRPVPDGSCDLTAHVAMDALPHAELVRQRDVLRDLGVTGAMPPTELARRDPAAYLRELSRCSAQAALIAPHGLGGFLWAFSRRPGGTPAAGPCGAGAGAPVEADRPFGHTGRLPPPEGRLR